MVRSIGKQMLFFTVSVCVAFVTLLILTPNVYESGMSIILKEHMLSIILLTSVFVIIINYWSYNVTVNSSKYSRSSNLELCRVICMLLIIAHHAVVHGGILNVEGMTTNKFFSLFLVPVGKLAFDCFIAISCWFLVDQKFKMNKFLKVWVEVVFYSVSFTVVSYIMGAQLSWRNWFSVFLPISGNSHGFAASYLAFYLLIPFLNRMTYNLTKKQARILLALLFYFEVGTQIIGYFAQYKQPMASELFVFILIYILMFNLKKWPVKIFNKKIFSFVVCSLILGLIWIAWYCNFIIPGNQFSQFMLTVMCDESSVTNIIGGVALFYFFINLNIKTLPLINNLATCTLGVLLFHDHNFFRYIFWPQIVKTPEWYESTKYILLISLFVIWIFVIGFIIDQFRKTLIESPLFRIKKIRAICEKYDDIVY